MHMRAAEGEVAAGIKGLIRVHHLPAVTPDSVVYLRHPGVT
jgi:hypothetical protein